MRTGISITLKPADRRRLAALARDRNAPIKTLESENKQLRRAVSDLTLEKLILKEAASGNW